MENSAVRGKLPNSTEAKRTEGGLFFTAGEDPRVCHLGRDFREGTVLLTWGRGEVDPWKEKETEKEQSGLKEYGMPGSYKKPREPTGSATLGETGSQW